MNFQELIQNYPPNGPLVFITGQPDFSDFGTRLLNVYPEIRQLIQVIGELF